MTISDMALADAILERVDEQLAVMQAHVHLIGETEAVA